MQAHFFKPLSKRLTFFNALPILSTLIILGALGILGFAPFYIFIATPVSLAGLFYFWHRASSPKEAAVMGFIYGLGFYIAGIYWIYISLHIFGKMPMLMAAIATFLLCAFMALFIALTGWLSVRYAKNNRIHLVILIAVFWALSDWVRSWIFTGFPWLTVGYSQVPSSPLAGFAPVLGIYGVSLTTVLIASLIGFYFAHKTELSLKIKRHISIVISALLLFGFAFTIIPWSKPMGGPISVSLLQGNIAQSIKWESEIAEYTMQQYVEMAESSNAKLIVMPETALPILSSQMPMSIAERLKNHAIKNNGDIVIGIVELENSDYFNSAMSIGSNPTQTYRKSHLVPFGEFIPFKAVFGWIYRDWLNMPLSDISRGSYQQQPMQIAGLNAALNICYEDVFGEEIIRQLPEADILINITNDAWYGESLAAYQHLQFSQARALETGRMMLRATNTGATAIIDTKGHLLAHAPHFQTTILNGFAQTHRGTTPYVHFGNWLFLILCASLLLWVWLQKRKRSISNTPPI
jgi:apolipoprotein N-acyltransferase